MSEESASRSDWPRALRWYLGASFMAHLVWEVLQLPLYTLWTTGTPREQSFAVVHCTTGDVMIAGLSLLAVLSVLGRPKWPAADGRPVWLATLLLGVGYTIYSEWLNVSVRGSWSYSDLMPTLPPLGTGLAPLLQWIIVPTLVLWIATGRRPWTERDVAIT
ncbi:MAG: hypothetical protein CTY20_05425 [Hyphomicrobium sp.]|nr:MAG: hypothetical protein CTY20_05425 [Hyphomicrobium sp.]